ncbi:hypothetical protein EHS25_000873 [Saitozyma podzolica]|uniref:Uncharacterized protein n=1 Tax=Saitozyma podzolica TaxID=1890683 RepID=A0A427YXH7_9TREE|nr:hypothetical protein EHS25_000873 [Saitozyma podzolica]
MAAKIALVTGASSGIGRGAAIALSKAGWIVVLSGRRRDALKDTVKMMGESDGGKARVMGEGESDGGKARGDEDVDFEARIRSEHGSKSIAASTPSPGPTSVLPINAYSGPEMKGGSHRSEPIQQVPSDSPYTLRPQQVVHSQISFPSPPLSSGYHHRSLLTPQSPHFTTAISSLASSPVSEDCRTPLSATVMTSACRSMKS